MLAKGDRLADRLRVGHPVGPTSPEGRARGVVRAEPLVGAAHARRVDAAWRSGVHGRSSDGAAHASRATAAVAATDAARTSAPARASAPARTSAAVRVTRGALLATNGADLRWSQPSCRCSYMRKFRGRRCGSQHPDPGRKCFASFSRWPTFAAAPSAGWFPTQMRAMTCRNDPSSLTTGKRASLILRGKPSFL